MKYWRVTIIFPFLVFLVGFGTPGSAQTAFDDLANRKMRDIDRLIEEGKEDIEDTRRRCQQSSAFCRNLVEDMKKSLNRLMRTRQELIDDLEAMRARRSRW